MESLSCFEVKSIVFPSQAGMYAMLRIAFGSFAKQNSISKTAGFAAASSPPSLSRFGSWCVALQYTASREEAAKKAASMFKAVGAKDFKNSPSVVVSPSLSSAVPLTDANLLWEE
jgi:hypothetical protein